MPVAGADAIAAAAAGCPPLPPSWCERVVARLVCARASRQSEIEETLERIKSHDGVEGYVIMNNEGEVLRKLPGMSNEKAKEYGEEIYSLARKARHVVRDINPRVRVCARTAVLVAPAVGERRVGESGSFGVHGWQYAVECGHAPGVLRLPCVLGKPPPTALTLALACHGTTASSSE